MAAGPARPLYPNASRQLFVRGRRWREGLAALAATALAVSGCGQSIKTDLPDLATKQAPLPGGSKALSSAEQKQAVDRMIAKREAMEKEPPK